MKRFLIASALFAVALAAQAQSGATVTVQDDAAVAGDAQATTAPAATGQIAADGSTQVAADDADKNDLYADRTCLRETGSVILARSNAKLPKDQQKCATANGRSYSRDDIDRTGSTDLAEALRRLDPSIH